MARRDILVKMSAAASVLPTDTVVHAERATYVAPAAHSTYAAPASHDLYIAPAGPGASEAAIHGVGTSVNAHG
jgi:hypothetical protein